MAAGKYQRWLEPDGLVLLEGWARDGLTQEQMAHNMGCSLSTLKDWIGKYPAISAAIKKGREVCDYMVENALVKRALGYTYEEVTVEQRPDGNVRKLVKKQVPPDVGAAIFYLKNRMPKKWRDKPMEEGQDDAAAAKAAAVMAEVRRLMRGDGQ